MLWLLKSELLFTAWLRQECIASKFKYLLSKQRGTGISPVLYFISGKLLTLV
ncbi:hypothetical protein KKC1_21800 [Calderihabitans maritimus]|uniref:Uncharacterized protein n=1 Tax=Calderihabitans maritimus TaxID=1246530 RepID=A0A1Z5HU21_9FIRM|nr:hypothetical protein KKC1_21800 [Calderihabitans maritimus]